jgi:hypothetical protein
MSDVMPSILATVLAGSTFVGGPSAGASGSVATNRVEQDDGWG